jgi:hypothetical protein
MTEKEIKAAIIGILSRVHDAPGSAEWQRIAREDPEYYRALELVSHWTEEVGPNGHPVGYTDNGDYVEWFPNEEEEGGEPFPMILRRNDGDIADAYHEFRNKVWWFRHQDWLEELRAGTNKHPGWAPHAKLLAKLCQEDPDPDVVMAAEELPKNLREILAGARTAALCIEEKYGRENLEKEDHAVLYGQMLTLAWVLGSEWDEAGST